jgi:phosphopantothenoylcysteine decarboxylase/phosphopantothenate--cysteine ligase
VRFIANHSSGKMGIALANAAYELGAEVVLICGPSKIETAKHIKRINVITADEMYQASIKAFENTDICIMAAAVADYKAKEIADKKIKKQSAAFELKLEKTKDILLALGERKKPKQFLMGFALETDNEIKNAKTKLNKKNLDAIVLNSLQEKGSGFSYDTNRIQIIDKNNNIINFPLKAKTDVAYDIFAYICDAIKK